MDRYNHEHYPDPTANAVIAKATRKNKSKYRPFIYICSPFRGDEAGNTLKARQYCRFSVKHGNLPIAPHLYFPQFLKDNDEDERETAMEMNFILLGRCRELWVFGDRITDGMRREIAKAKWDKKIIRYFTSDMEEIL